jgi:AraC family transcriptional regulator
VSKAVRIFQGTFGRVALLDMTEPLVVHAHSQCHVLLKAGGADTFFRVRDVDHPLRDDTAVLVNTWEPHCYAHRPGAPRSLILALYIEPFWLAAIDGAFRRSIHPRFFPAACADLTPEVRRLAERLTEEMLFDGELDERALESLMCAVILHFSGLRATSAGELEPDRVFTDFRVRKAIAHMRAHPAEPVDADALARIAGLSRPHFFELFRRCTRLTPGVYANVLRMESAIRALSQSGAPMVEISDELSFSAQSHFTRFFRHHLGISPTEYRRVVSLVEREGPSDRPV